MYISSYSGYIQENLLERSDYNSLNHKYEQSTYGEGRCLGIRLVITLKSGVYIKSGTGTEEDPYILGKD